MANLLIATYWRYWEIILEKCNSTVNLNAKAVRLFLSPISSTLLCPVSSIFLIENRRNSVAVRSEIVVHIWPVHRQLDGSAFPAISSKWIRIQRAGGLMSKPISKFDFLRIAHLWIIKLIDWNAARSKAGKRR